MKDKILVTGASGFIGRQTLRPLLEKDFEVHGLCRHPLVDVANVHWHVCDIFQSREVEELVNRLKPSHLLHCAWITEHGKFWHAAENTEWLEASKNLFNIFAKAGGRHIVGLGSCSEYDWNRRDASLWKETDVCRPQTAYGQAKLDLALWLNGFANASGIAYAWVRLFLLFGEHENPNRIVPYLILSALKGNRAKCTSGTQVRDFLDTETCGRLLAEITSSDMEGIVNLASGRGATIRELAGMIENNTESEFCCEFGAIPDRANDPPFMVADISKLKAYSPFIKHFDLEKSLARTVKYWSLIQ